MFYFHSLDGSTVGTRKRFCVFGGRGCCFDCLLTVFDEWYTLYQSSKALKTIGVPIVTCLHRVRRIHKAVCAYQQCCHLANGNKTCPSLLVFKNNNMGRGSQEFVRGSSRNTAHVQSNHLYLTSFFHNYNILLRSGARAESLRAGSENMPNFVTFWPTLQFKDDQKKIQVVTSSMTLKVHHV